MIVGGFKSLRLGSVTYCYERSVVKGEQCTAAVFTGEGLISNCIILMVISI